MNWLNFAIKSVMLVEAITGLDGPSKKEKAVGLSLGFASLLGMGFTERDKQEVGQLVDSTVSLFNKEGVFQTSTPIPEEGPEPTVEEKEDADVSMRETGFSPEKKPEAISEKEKEPEVEEWPLKHYTAEVYLERWPKGQWAELARKLTSQ